VKICLQLDERSVESLIEAAFKMARKLIVMAGIEKDLARREGRKIYVIEHVLSDLVRNLVALLHEHKGRASDKLRELAKPVGTFAVE